MTEQHLDDKRLEQLLDELEIEIGAYLTVVTDHQEATAKAIADPFGMPVEPEE